MISTKSTRRTFLGAATAATALTLASSAGAEQMPMAGAKPDATKVAQLKTSAAAAGASAPSPATRTKPAAMAIPKEGYFQLEQGRYGPIFPRTPANYGFSILAKIKPGTEERLVSTARRSEAVAGDPFVFAPLKLHYLRWLLFNIGSDTYFMYQGIFDTDFDKYTEDAVAIFGSSGINTIFETLEGVPARLEDELPRRLLSSSANIRCRVFSSTANILCHGR